MRSEATAARFHSAVAAPAHRSSRNSAGWLCTGAVLERGNRDVGRSRADLAGEGLAVVPSILFLRMGGGRGCAGGGRLGSWKGVRCECRDRMMEYSRKTEEDEKSTADDDGEGYPATPGVPVGIGAVAIVVAAECQTGPLDRWFKVNLPVASKKDSHDGFRDVDGRVEWRREAWERKKKRQQDQSG